MHAWMTWRLADCRQSEPNDPIWPYALPSGPGTDSADEAEERCSRRVRTSAWNENSCVKLPAFMFYPGHWLRDAALRRCSIEARGLRIDLLALMSRGEPYGDLRLGNADVDNARLARMVGESKNKIARLLRELETAGV